MSNNCPIYESTFLDKVLGFLENFSISKRYRWVPNKGAERKIGNDNDTKWEEYEAKHAYRSYGRWFQWFDEL